MIVLTTQRNDHIWKEPR